MKKDDVVSIGVLAAFFVGFIVVIYAVKSYKCNNYESMTGMQTEFKLFDGCYVKTNKGWFLKEQLRDINPS